MVVKYCICDVMNILYLGMINDKFDGRNHEVRVAETMAKMGHNVYLVVQRKPKYEPGEKPKKLFIFPMPVDKGPLIYQMIGLGSGVKEKHLLSLDGIDKEKKFDIIFSSSASGAPLAYRLKKRYNCKSIVQVLDIPMWLIKNKELKTRLMYTRRWKKWVPYLMAANRLIVNNQITVEELPQLLEIFKIKGEFPGVRIIQYGITTQLIDEIPVQKESDQMIFLSRLVKHKGIDLLLKAVSLVKNAPKLVILGGGQERKKLEKLAIKLGINVEFKGGVSDKKKITEIKKSKFMIYTSTTESIAGLAPLESLYCEKPCICFDIRILKELYHNHVEYVPKGNVKELAKKIDELNNNKLYRVKKGKEGKVFVKNNLTNEVFVRKMIKVFKKEMG